jgi:hypothetical protein
MRGGAGFRRYVPDQRSLKLSLSLSPTQPPNDATELAHADMTTLPKVDTNCTALSLMPTIIGNTFAASLARTSVRSERKLVHVSRTHPFNLNFLIRLWSDGPEVALNWLFPYPI